MNLYIHKHVYTHTHTHTHTHIYIYMYIHTHTHIHIHMCTSAREQAPATTNEPLISGQGGGQRQISAEDIFAEVTRRPLEN